MILSSFYVTRLYLLVLVKEICNYVHEAYFSVISGYCVKIMLGSMDRQRFPPPLLSEFVEDRCYFLL